MRNKRIEKKGKTSRTNATKIKNIEYNKANNIQEDETQEIFFGRHIVLSLLEKSNKKNKLFIQKGVSGEKIKRILYIVKEQGIVYQEVPKSKLDELTNNGNHQGVVLTMSPIEYSTLEDCFALAASRNESPFFVILDGIEDPHNLGSIIRTADAAGVHGIIIPKRRAVGLTGVVAKTSVGAIERVPVVRVTNIVQTIEHLKSQNVWVFATDMTGQDMRQWDTQGAIAIVIGNEGEGVSQLVSKVVDGTVMIPMVGEVESLNASVAASLLMYEVARNRI